MSLDSFFYSSLHRPPFCFEWIFRRPEFCLWCEIVMNYYIMQDHGSDWQRQVSQKSIWIWTWSSLITIQYEVVRFLHCFGICLSFFSFMYCSEFSFYFLVLLSAIYKNANFQNKNVKCICTYSIISSFFERNLYIMLFRCRAQFRCWYVT